MTDLVEQITLAYEQDQKKSPVAELSSELPISFESITPRWLTNVLCWGVIGAEVVDLKLDVLDVGRPSPRKMEVAYNEKGQLAGLPTKLFCKATHGLASRVTLGTTGAIQSEVMFYKDIRSLIDIETPQCLFAAYDDHSFNSMIIMTDLSDRMESLCDHRTPMNKARAKSQLKLLATLHSKFYRSEKLENAFATLPTWPDWFARAVRYNNFETGAYNGFLAAEEVIPTRLYKQVESIWPATIAAVEQHRSLPHTIAHNDVHLKNWYVLPNDEMGLSDWECCSRGHWSRDLAYLISTALTVEDRRAWERDLIDFYLAEMARHGVSGTSFEQAWELYRQQLVSVLAWWTIPLVPPEGMPDRQPPDTALEFIHRITSAMDDLDSLSLA